MVIALFSIIFGIVLGKKAMFFIVSGLILSLIVKLLNIKREKSISGVLYGITAVFSLMIGYFSPDYWLIKVIGGHEQGIPAGVSFTLYIPVDHPLNIAVAILSILILALFTTLCFDRKISLLGAITYIAGILYLVSFVGMSPYTAILLLIPPALYFKEMVKKEEN